MESHFLWQLLDPKGKTYSTLAWRMTEDEAHAWMKAHGITQYRKVKGSEQLRQTLISDGAAKIPNQPLEN